MAHEDGGTGGPGAAGTGSLTAHWIAAARAREATRPDALFRDPYAAALAGGRGATVLAVSEAASGGENAFLPLRTRFFDDLLLREAAGLDQVVLLGAGFDTRAFRLPGLGSVRWFEVDTAGVFSVKEPTLAAAGAVAPCERRLVVADLGGDWDRRLLDAGLSAGRRTGWVAEGLLYYLSPDAVARLLAVSRRLSGPGSWFAADVSGSGLLALPMMASALQARRAQGLPPPFTTDDPAALFAGAGWAAVDLPGLSELALACGRKLARPPGSLGQAHADRMRTHLVVARA